MTTPPPPPKNVCNRTLFTFDNLPVMRCINDASVDLIYLDPPFNSGKQWENPIRAGGKKAVASFKDTWSPADIHVDDRYELGQLCPKALPLIDALHQVNGGSWWAYLIYMGARLVEMKRILKPTGSIYYHCDPVMSHGVKLLMDAIFDKNNFRNEIVWSYPASPSNAKKGFPSKHDIIFRYSKSNNFVFNVKDVSVPYSESSMERIKYSANASKVMRGNEIKLRKDGKLPTSVWQDIQQTYRYRKEITGYPTQKPLALLERIIKASSNKGDVVLDPFCGCATACIAAERARRQWIGIDLAETAANLVYGRLKKDTESPLADPKAVVIHETKLPKRTDIPPLRDRDGLKAELHHLQQSKCVLCFDVVPLGGMDLDHIIPRARGGQNIPRNYQLLCGECNSRKSDKPMETARKDAAAIRIEKQEKADRDAWEKRREENRSKLRSAA